jgi:hypothetical protein
MQLGLKNETVLPAALFEGRQKPPSWKVIPEVRKTFLRASPKFIVRYSASRNELVVYRKSSPLVREQKFKKRKIGKFLLFY